MKPDKPQTRESVESAKRFAASLPALPEQQYPAALTATSKDHRESLIEQCLREFMSITETSDQGMTQMSTIDGRVNFYDKIRKARAKAHYVLSGESEQPTDYERGFADCEKEIIKWMLQKADEMKLCSQKFLREGNYTDHIEHENYWLSFSHVLAQLNTKAGLRKAQEIINKH